MINLIGREFGRLYVFGFSHIGPDNHSWWHCVCECGTETVVKGRSMKNGGTTSCGCFRRERMTTHGQRGTAQYFVWQAAKNRTTNPNDQHWSDYGGRGITMCARYRSREGYGAFFSDMGERPEGLTLDRVDNDGGYWCGKCEECIAKCQPFNIRWATRLQQAHNKRPRQRPAR